MPPNFRNHGNYVISVSKLSRFLAEQAEEKGAYILTETVADKLLVEDRIVRGIRSGDRGRGKDGEPLGNFEPGSDVVAKTTVLAEGTLGHLTQAALDYFDLHGSLPVRWELGVKEVWEVEKPLDRVIHTMGWPLRKRAKWNEFGGSFIYPMGEDKLCIGLVIGLDYTDSTLSCHDLLQELKTHPFVKQDARGRQAGRLGREDDPLRRLLLDAAQPLGARDGDRRRRARTWSTSRPSRASTTRCTPGMYAAEAIFEALKTDSVNLDAYDERVRKSADRAATCSSRATCAQPFSKGFFVGGAVASAMTITKGLFPGGKWKYEPDTEIPMARRRRQQGLPEARQRAHLQQARLGLPLGQRDPRRRAQPRQDPEPRPARAREDLGQPLPGAGLRDPRRPARERRRRGRRPRHRVELRPVRRDQRQGRAPDDARGRRRAALPRGLTATPDAGQAARRLRGRRAPDRARRQGGARRDVRAAQRAVALPALHDRGQRALGVAAALPDRGRPPRPRGADRLRRGRGRRRRRRALRPPRRRSRAEAAVTVVDDWQGRGLGTALCELLAERAREEGIDRFTALLLAGNDQMHDVLAALGPAKVISRDAGTIERRGRDPRERDRRPHGRRPAGRRRRHGRARDAAVGAADRVSA